MAEQLSFEVTVKNVTEYGAAAAQSTYGRAVIFGLIHILIRLP